MGNTSSTPSSSSSSNSNSHSAPNSRPRPSSPRPGLRRRISTFIRGGSDQGNKRERSNSNQPSLAAPKRRRVSPDSDPRGTPDPREPREDVSMYSSPVSAGPSSGPSRVDSVVGSLHTAHSQVAASSRPETLQPGDDDAASPLSPASPATDELLSDRLRSISTIQDTLGDALAPDWAPTVPRSATPSLMSRFRALRDETGSNASTTSLASAQTPSGTSRFTHRLSAIMGLATPERRQSPSTATAPETAAEPPPVAPSAPETSQAEEESGGIPVGAVLVIQGLAQTHAHQVEGSEDSEHPPPIDIPSLDQQARMIGNLLTVAAAATATTLLSPESLNTQPSRSTAQSAMQTIIERLRPSRARASQSVEAALGDYLRSVLRDNRRLADAVTGESRPSANVPAEFQGFLQTLQEDLIQAVRAYALPEGMAAGDGAGDGVAAAAAAASEGQDIQASDSVEVSMPGAFENGSAEVTSEAEPLAEGTEPLAEGTEPAASQPVPSFHHQPSQNLPMANLGRGLGVSGGADGVPRRLNFFRAHLFPTVHENGSSADSTEDDAIVPSIFVGVRSIAHNPTLTTEDLVAHPSFPFMDGQVPEEGASAAPEATTTTAPLSDDAHNFDRDLEQELAPAPSPSLSTASNPRRTLRNVLERLAGTTPAPPRTRPALPMNTYLIYVIGGNYPRSHPVLSIPALVSGGPLSAEDLQLVSELLGPAKPPTVTQDEIDAAGLKVLQGSELRDAQERGQVLESSVERCMVCLSEYEDADPCRVLKCRHAFHAECVDQWLTTGRNSCPSCRTEAVDKSTPAPKAADPIPDVEDGDAV